MRFVVEVYAPAVSVGGLPQLASRAHAAAHDSSLAGVNVRYLRSVLVPEDDECASVKPCLEEGVTEPKGGKP